MTLWLIFLPCDPRDTQAATFRSRNIQTRITQSAHRTLFINHFRSYKNLKRLPQTLVVITKITGSPFIIPGNKTELYTQKYKNNSIKVFRPRNTQTRITQFTHRTPFINHFHSYKKLKRLPQTLVVTTDNYWFAFDHPWQQNRTIYTEIQK